MRRRAALNSFLRANEARVYDLGVWDCAVFAFGAVAAQTGTDHLAEYWGRYTDYDEAVLLMKQLDRVATLRTLTSVKLGEPVPVAQAQTGDVVSLGASLGILYGDRGVFLAEHQGYERVSRAKLDHAWPAGR